MKKILSFILALTMLLALCACGTPEPEETTVPAPQTPEEFLDKMQEALAAAPCSRSRVQTELAMTLDAGEMGTMNMCILTDAASTISWEPISCHTETAVTVDFGGEVTQTVTDSYTVEEAGTLVTYTNSGSIWTMEQTGITAEKLQAVPVQADPAKTGMDETVTQWEGREVVCLNTVVTGSGMETMLDTVLSELENIEAAPDLSALSCDVKLYLDKATYQPVYQEMTVNGLDGVLNPLYAESGMTVQSASCKSAVTFLSCEPQTAAVLPEGAKERAELWTRLLSTGSPDNGDGTFTLHNNTFLLDVKMPEGFELDSSNINELIFRREDYRQLWYNLHYGTEADLQSVVDNRVKRYTGLANSVSRESMELQGDTLDFHCEILGIQWSTYEEGQLFAYADLGSDGIANYYLFVNVTDGYNDGFGTSKSADITAEEFMAYLNAATVSPLN